MSAGQAKKQVLVVDDEPDLLEFVTLVLEDVGYSVAHASNGREALEKVEAERPDLVILDIMMPEMDGWGFLERVNKMPDAPAVVILSAFTDDMRAFRAGAWESLSKPFQPEDLLETCRRALERP
jgi:CheY-like chemotaxis protein